MKEELINHWTLIVRAVITAEDAISEEWIPKLKAAKGGKNGEIEKVAHEYCRAIAIEILSHAEKEETT